MNNRYSYIGLLITAAALFCAQVANFHFDRREHDNAQKLAAIIAEKQEFDRRNRAMLDARAIIQMTLTCSADRRGVLTEEERARLKSLGEVAEYHLAENPPCDFFKVNE